MFSLGTDERGDVYAMNADGSGRTRLTRLGADAGSPFSPLWSPDGERIAFLLPGEPPRNERGRLGAAGSDALPERRSSRRRSPGRRTAASIAFARLKLGRDRRASGIYLAEIDGGEPSHRLTRNIDSNPSWSPDGRQIAFQRLTGFHISQITLMDRDGSNQGLDKRRLVGEATWRPAAGRHKEYGGGSDRSRRRVTANRLAFTGRQAGR